MVEKLLGGVALGGSFDCESSVGSVESVEAEFLLELEFVSVALEGGLSVSGLAFDGEVVAGSSDCSVFGSLELKICLYCLSCLARKIFTFEQLLLSFFVDLTLIANGSSSTKSSVKKSISLDILFPYHYGFSEGLPRTSYLYFTSNNYYRCAER